MPAARGGRRARKRKRRPARTGDYRARSEARNAEARAALVPLREGERPRAVSVGAVVAAVLALVNVVAYLAGLEVRDERPPILGVLLYSGLMLLMAWGLWRARYWAVLGLQALLGLLILLFSLLLVRAENVLAAGLALAIIGLAGTLFWFLVKAMARIQMPVRR